MTPSGHMTSQEVIRGQNMKISKNAQKLSCDLSLERKLNGECAGHIFVTPSGHMTSHDVIGGQNMKISKNAQK